MINRLTDTQDFQTQALTLRAERQRLIASNIANADTPGYVGRDMHFTDALREANASGSLLSKPSDAQTGGSNQHHIPLSPTLPSSSTSDKLGYTVQTQPSLDKNTVDMDRERANFTDNAVRYEATLRFLNGQAKTMLSAIQGQ